MVKYQLLSYEETVKNLFSVIDIETNLRDVIQEQIIPRKWAVTNTNNNNYRNIILSNFYAFLSVSD
jgi:hypothetical protein